MTESNEAQPYQSPAEVIEPASGGMLRSPVAWIVAVLLLGAIASGMMLAPVADQVEDFGGGRMAIEDDAYGAPSPAP